MSDREILTHIEATHLFLSLLLCLVDSVCLVHTEEVLTEHLQMTQRMDAFTTPLKDGWLVSASGSPQASTVSHPYASPVPGSAPGIAQQLAERMPK